MTSKLKRVVNNFVAVVAERNFKKASLELCTPIPPDVLEQMAVRRIRVEDIMRQTGHRFPPYNPNVFVDYLMSLSDYQMLELLEKDLPAHVAVLRRHPEFCGEFIQDLKRLAGVAARR